jgi:hypothetical protein
MGDKPAGKYASGVGVGKTGGRAVGGGGMERAVSVGTGVVGWVAGAGAVGVGAACIWAGWRVGVAGSGLGAGSVETDGPQALINTSSTIRKIK